MPADRRRISHNVADITISAIKEMAMLAAGIDDVASLTWGLPSFRTPEHIRRGVAQAMKTDADIGKYALPDGLPELRRLAVEAHRKATGIGVDPDRNVVITAGNMQGMNALLHVLINPGDEIVVTDPGFASHFQQIRLCGGTPVYWPLKASEDWALDLDLLPELIGARTKAIILVSPSNPTGKIFLEADLRRVGEIARERDVLIAFDDPYCHFTYENTDRYFNLSSVPELGEHIAYMFTFSKTHAMSGWRLAYMILPEKLKGELLKVHDATIICAPRISQVAGTIALREAPTHLQEFETTLARRRDLICERLDAVPHVFEYTRPEGAYYVFPKITADHEDSREFAIRLLDEARVTVTPGRAFGPTGEHHVRMAYCVEEDVINKAFDRIEGYFGR